MISKPPVSNTVYILTISRRLKHASKQPIYLNHDQRVMRQTSQHNPQPLVLAVEEAGGRGAETTAAAHHAVAVAVAAAGLVVMMLVLVLLVLLGVVFGERTDDGTTY